MGNFDQLHPLARIQHPLFAQIAIEGFVSCFPTSLGLGLILGFRCRFQLSIGFRPRFFIFGCSSLVVVLQIRGARAVILKNWTLWDKSGSRSWTLWHRSARVSTHIGILGLFVPLSFGSFVSLFRDIFGYPAVLRNLGFSQSLSMPFRTRHRLNNSVLLGQL